MSDFSRYEPVSRADIAAKITASPTALLIPAVPAPASEVLVQTTPATERPTPEDAPRFVGGRVRSMEVRLDYPIEFRGHLYETITLRRPTAAEVGLWFERLAEATAVNPTATLHFPIFVDEAGTPIPPQVLDFLDGADDERVMEMSADFLPPQFRRMQERAAAFIPRSGGPTEPSSSS